MAIWDRLKDGIDKANRVALDALDEGKTRLDARKTRQAADQAAESLGYAVFRAWESGRNLEPETLDRLARALRDHEQEAVRLEQAAAQSADWRRREDQTMAEPAADAGAPDTAPAAPPPAPASPADAAPPGASATGASATGASATGASATGASPDQQMPNVEPAPGGTSHTG
jgi:hypothetical protein